MTWAWPQITMIALLCLGDGIALTRHGEKKTGEHNFGISLFGTALTVGLLYAGGFWSGGCP